jgi:hypothetical protein
MLCRGLVCQRFVAPALGPLSGLYQVITDLFCPLHRKFDILDDLAGTPAGHRKHGNDERTDREPRRPARGVSRRLGRRWLAARRPHRLVALRERGCRGLVGRARLRRVKRNRPPWRGAGQVRIARRLGRRRPRRPIVDGTGTLSLRRFVSRSMSPTPEFPRPLLDARSERYPYRPSIKSCTHGGTIVPKSAQRACSQAFGRDNIGAGGKMPVWLT